MKIKQSLVIFIITLLFISGSNSAYAATVTFQQGVNGYSSGEDSEIASDYPSTNFSNGGSSYSDRMAVRFCATKCNKILLRFGNLGITGTITNVRLELKESGQQGGSNYIYAHKISKNDWVNSVSTWSTYKTGSAWSSLGGDSGSALATASAPGSNSWVTLDLGSNWTLSELQQNGILVDTDIPGWNHVWFYSNEAVNPSDRPKITITYDTTGVSDTVLPTVSISSPMNASTVSGSSVSVSADASDNVGVAGVQFKIDGINVGTEDISAPYSTTLNTTTYGNGTTHTISAIARDFSGNQTTSSVAVTVNNSVTTPAPTVSLSASPSTVTSGTSSTLTWSSSNATSCSGSGSWSGSKATTGSEVTPALSAASTYTLSCTGAGGTASQSVVVGVGSVVVVTPTSGGLKIDLSYASQTSTAFSRFKSLVDDALAGRPDYGFAPEQAAYMYKMTGEVKYCDYAVTFAESCPNSYDRQYGINCGVQGMESDIAAGRQPYVAGDSYLEVGPIIGSMAVTYDWCGFRMTDSQKTRWANIANQAIYNVWHPDQATWGGRSFPWSGWSINNPGNNYYYSFLKATMYWALATKDSTLLSFTRNQKLQPLVDYFSRLPGGGSLEGTGYGTAHMNMFQLYQVWKDSTGEDLANMNSHLSDTIRLWLHQTTPNRAYYDPVGDLARSSFPDLFDYHRRLVLEARNLTNNTVVKDVASWWLNNISVNQMSRRVDSQWDLLPAGTSSVSTPNEPLTYRASGIGRIFARTGWDTNALWMTFVAGKYNESHAHQDQGSFDLANNQWLAVSNNIYTASGIEQATDYHNVLRFTQNGSIIPQREGTESVMTVNQLSANGDVDVTGNLTPAYGGNPAIQNWTRNIKFSQRKLTVTDNFTVTSGTQAVFQLDVPVQPVVSGNTITAGALKVRVVSPASPTINVVSQGKYRIDIGGGTTQYVVELSDQTISSTTTPPVTLPVTPAPTVSLSASPSTVTSGTSSTLTWSSSNATSCSGSGSWSGSKATTGSEVTPALSAASTYTLSCTGAGGTASQSVVVGVGSVVVVTPTPTTPPTSNTIAIGVRVKVVSSSVSVRSGAGTIYRKLGTQIVGALGTVVDGPRYKNGYTWWKINYDTGVDGWSVGNYLSVYVPTTASGQSGISQVASVIASTSGINNKITRQLYLGISGPDVSTLQGYLISKGYLGSEFDTGYFGALTKEAVKKLQCEKLQVCSGDENSTGWGSVGVRTRTLMYSED